MSALTKNKHILNWIDEMSKMTKPDAIVWIDGSEKQAEELRNQACATGEIVKLNQDKLPGCYLHNTAINDVARVEGTKRATGVTAAGVIDRLNNADAHLTCQLGKLGFSCNFHAVSLSGKKP